MTNSNEAIWRVEKKGFIPSHQAGDIGVGKTLEDELGVEENSVQVTELGEVELKVTRGDSNSKLTLFTQAPKKLYHVQAEVKKEDDGSESFHYNEAYSLEDFSAERMIEGLKSGELDVDIRLGVYASGDRKGKPHDNGTAIRASSKKLDECFDKKKRFL